MVGIIYDLKNQLLEQLEKDVSERGIDRLDKEKVDMVKDLAEAEASCWKAEYYRSVTEAMDGNGMGYDGGSQGAGMQQGPSSYGMGYRASGRGSANQYGWRRGYSMGYDLDGLRMAMQSADPQERERMRRELQQML